MIIIIDTDGSFFCCRSFTFDVLDTLFDQISLQIDTRLLQASEQGVRKYNQI